LQMISVAVEGGRFLLMLMMIVAGAAKLRDFNEFRNLFESLVRPRLLSHAAVGVPLAELAAVVLLGLRPRVGGVLVLLLLAAFSAFAATRLVDGQRIKCACFGSLSDSVLGRGTLIRNALLGGVALGVVLSPPSFSAASLPNALIAALVGCGAVLVGRTWNDARLSRTQILELVSE
jgi:hypothetical protein